jgi:aspartyl-tRNA(Asn)/glutamyl-tRNA(Gln) amidotransferase subunit A
MATLGTIPKSETIVRRNKRFVQGQASRLAEVETCLAAAQGEAAKHVFTKLYPEAALAAARHADAMQVLGVAQHPLAGLPITIKDLYDVAGETTMAGSIACRGEPVALSDAPVVTRLRQSGAAILGKTNMTEFAFSGVGINPHYGTPRNPSDSTLARIPGGSSSGAAVSVALGLAVAGLGSDTGGSIRIPAALNGLVGFKCTQRRVPLTGAFELARSLDTVCAMTRSVEDCIIVDSVLSGHTLAPRVRPLSTMRFALPQTLVLDDLDSTVAQAYRRALSALSAAGAQLVEMSLSELGEVAALNSPGGFSPIEANAVHFRRLAERRAMFDPRVATRIDLGSKVTAQQYLVMQDQRRNWIKKVETSLQGFDAVLCPTVPIVAPEIEPLVKSDEAFSKANAKLLRNTFLFNFLDACSFSLPCQREGELPVGLMVSAVGGRDRELAEVALAIEAALENSSGD